MSIDDARRGALAACPTKRRWKVSRRLAKPAELSLYVLLATGLLLFAPFGLSWAVVRWALVVHVVSAIVFVPCLVVPFWISHRGLVTTTRKRFLRITGRILELVFVAMFASGAFLLFVGWNGTFAGGLAHDLHLLLAVPVILVVAAHAWRFSFLKALVTGALVAGFLGGLAMPAASAPKQASSAVESTSLLLEAGGNTLLSANFDGGSVSRVDRRTGKRVAEAAIGGDITALTVDADDGLVAASDFTGNRVVLLDRASLKVERTIAIEGRPAGIVYDARNRLFWVAATEGDQLYALSPDGRIEADMKVAESPRGLALMPDGRLLVSHSMIGAVSIYDTTRLPAKRTKLIRLGVEQNTDETVSQGLPRRLDRIAVSPDGKQAWLPHVLWNFDHPFQFQSTVFPAISVLSLKPGAEHEVLSRRKQLFKQINIVEDGQRTRIVSNPADVAFSADGGKAYVTFAGSEDLGVFDLSRAPPIDAANAKGTAGAKAVEIYRHLPGENPRGLVVSGDDIFVQNAMGLDLSKLSTGGSGPFARVKVAKAHFAKLVAADPLDPDTRRGERLFDLANTAAFPDAPMAGDNWMSCSSCHVDGFNFTNKALFQATPVDKFHSAFTGHGSIKRLVAGDFIGDYIRMIKNTQGGMGHDTRFDTPVTDPAHPSETVKAMMRDLHAYVTSNGNLPLLATWLRGKDGGASVDAKAWTNPALCGQCHSKIFKDWANSMHHGMAQSDPYYATLEDLAAKDEGEPFRAWCMGCHAPQQLLSGKRRTTDEPSRMFDTDGAALEARLKDYVHATDEGAGCLTCHRVEKIEDSGQLSAGNASIDLSPGDRPTYPGENSDWAALRAFAHRTIRARPQEHAQSMLNHIEGGNPKLCASCHSEFAPGTGAYIISTYEEWAHSSFNAPGDPAQNRTCADCHMHADVDRIGENVPGRATDGGAMKANVVSHRFTGAQYNIVGLRDPEARAQSIALLKSAARLSLQPGKAGTVTIRVANTGTGHDLPGGISNFRQMWLAFSVKDAAGRTVLTSGGVDQDGHVDEGARFFHKVLGDEKAHDVGLKFWRLARMAEDTRIPADGHRDETYALPRDVAYPLHVAATLRFRTFPRELSEMVKKRYPDLPLPKIVDMAHLTRTIDRP
ncbi:hypothetical protein [Pararhizobium mangrovi]|uniref:Cytochrome c domain-containing protein n=1 Tax=Pararhizobium mangrovi TaxID=2590452 RepID=A0A506UHK3_9HYPH|nr:hypothetical protein [Pararhizobium mangrovi]TPW32797.1 hypothetical protein FJU11_00805 [Pararhizobium mangrovi]